LTSTSELIDLSLLSNNGAGFVDLKFNVDVNGIWSYNDFMSLAAAQMFFSRNTLDFGPFGPGQQSVDIFYQLTLDGAGQGFGFDYALAPTALAPIPETSTWVMMLTGFAGLGFAAFRRSLRAKATFAA